MFIRDRAYPNYSVIRCSPYFSPHKPEFEKQLHSDNLPDSVCRSDCQFAADVRNCPRTAGKVTNRPQWTSAFSFHAATAAYRCV